jgi:8-oxo-dGTP diphosphatase
MPFCYEHPRPAVTVDCVVFGVHLANPKHPLKVLLVKRADEPFKGDWALPGGHVHTRDFDDDQGESLEAAAYRELEEETAVKVAYLEQLYTFGEPGRDPRGRYVSVAYFALVQAADYDIVAGSDAAEAQWMDVDSVLEYPMVAFDHDNIFRMALTRLQSKLRYTPIGENLLPSKFTLAQLQALYEAILMPDKPLDRRNFRRAILATGILKKVGESQNRSQPGPAASLYRFDKKAYERAKAQTGFRFEV